MFVSRAVALATQGMHCVCNTGCQRRRICMPVSLACVFDVLLWVHTRGLE